MTSWKEMAAVGRYFSSVTRGSITNKRQIAGPPFAGRASSLFHSYFVIKNVTKYHNKMSSNIWTSTEDAILINFVKKHDALYNVKNKGYRSGLLKQELWSQIGNLLKKKDSDCSKRWCYVRDYYIRRRGKPGIVSTGEAARNRAELLSFLDNLPTSKYEISTEDNTQDQIEENISQNMVCCDGPEDVPHKKKKLSHSEERESLKQIVESTQDEYDESDLFFISMAKIVKRLPRYEQVQLRMQIGSLVGNAELRSIVNDSQSNNQTSGLVTNLLDDSITVKIEHLE